MMVVAGACHKISDTVYDADFTTATVGDGSTPVANAGLIYERLSIQSTVRTGTNTVASGGYLGSVNIPVIQKNLDTDLPGLAMEESRQNYLTDSRKYNGTQWSAGSGTYTLTQDTAAGPDGSSVADRTQVNSSAYSNIWAPTTPTAAVGTYNVSYWHKQGASSVLGQSLVRSDGTTYTSIFSGTEPSVWTKSKANQTITVSQALLLFPAYGFDSTSVGGLAAGARDSLLDMFQVELGAFPTNQIITTGSAVTRAAPRLYKASGSSLKAADGSLRFYVECKPMGSSSQYSDDMTLWYDDANNHAEIDHTTQAVKITIGGTLYTTPVSMTWAEADTLRIWCATGGNVITEVKYSTNASSPVTLSTGTPPTFGAITISGNVDFFNANKSTVFSAIIQRMRTYKVGRKPVTF